MNQILHYAAMGTLGILFHIFVIKLPSLKKRSVAANQKFSVTDYFKDDWLTIVGSVLTVTIVIFGLDEILTFKPDIAGYIKWFLVFVGFTGSSVIQSVFSVANKKLMAVIDIKTNVADGVIPPVNEENKQGVKEIREKGE